MKKLISISLLALTIALISSPNTAEAKVLIRGGATVLVSPIGGHCRVRAHRGWRHHRAVVVTRPIVRMHRYGW
ncbi:MAG TPA: hypothetical protein PLX35_00560 [Cyclobacteriaceae bacterium]|nr:hypothetical protein [Cyclobacteriaceae bacterium]